MVKGDSFIDIEDTNTEYLNDVHLTKSEENLKNDEDKVARKIISYNYFFRKKRVKYSMKAFKELLSAKYFGGADLEQDVQNLNEGRKYVKLFTLGNSNIQIHAFFGFTGTVFLDKDTCKRSILCFLQTWEKKCSSVKLTVYFDHNDAIVKTELSTDNIDDNIIEELDGAWSEYDRKAIFRAMLVRCGLLKRGTDQTCILSTTGSVSLEENVRIQMKDLELAGAITYGKNTLRKGTETMYYKRDFDEHHFVHEKGVADYITEKDRFALPFCGDLKKWELPIDKDDWHSVKSVCENINTKTAELKFKKSFIVLDCNSLHFPWYTTEVSHLRKSKSGFKMQDLGFLFSQEKEKNPVVLYLENEELSYIFMEKGKLESLKLSSRFYQDRHLDKNSKTALLTSSEKWSYRTAIIAFALFTIGIGISALFRGNEAWENIVLAVIGTFSVFYLAIENAGFHLSCFPLREIIFLGRVEVTNWQQVRALQKNDSLKAKIWLYKEGQRWCPAEDFGASFIPGKKYCIFRHPGMSVEELQSLGIFLVESNIEDITERSSSDSQLIDFIKRQKLEYEKFNWQARVNRRIDIEKTPRKYRVFYVNETQNTTHFT